MCLTQTKSLTEATSHEKTLPLYLFIYLTYSLYLNIASHLRVTEEKSPLINQQSVVYEFTCDLRDTNYIGYICRHLHQRVEEHKHSVIGKYFTGRAWFNTGQPEPDNLIKSFKVIKKCRGKFEYLIYEMLLIKNKRPKLNTQADSIRAKLFT